MNIDLLLTSQGAIGLVSNEGFKTTIAGVMFDPDTGFLTLEFGMKDPIDLNIPVDQDISGWLQRALEIQIGIITDGIVADNRQVPLILTQDPFGGGNAGHFPVKPRQSVTDFENFMKNCNKGQPVHRDDFSDEDSAGSIMGGISPAVLQFAPHLARQRGLEAQPNLNYAPKAPGMAPGGGGGGGAVRQPPQQQSGQQGGQGHDGRRRTNRDDDDRR